MKNNGKIIIVFIEVKDKYIKSKIIEMKKTFNNYNFIKERYLRDKG